MFTATLLAVTLPPVDVKEAPPEEKILAISAPFKYVPPKSIAPAVWAENAPWLRTAANRSTATLSKLRLPTPPTEPKVANPTSVLTVRLPPNVNAV